MVSNSFLLDSTYNKKKTKENKDGLPEENNIKKKKPKEEINLSKNQHMFEHGLTNQHRERR